MQLFQKGWILWAVETIFTSNLSCIVFSHFVYTNPIIQCIYRDGFVIFELHFSFPTEFSTKKYKKKKIFKRSIKKSYKAFDIYFNHFPNLHISERSCEALLSQMYTFA